MEALNAAVLPIEIYFLENDLPIGLFAGAAPEIARSRRRLTATKIVTARVACLSVNTVILSRVQLSRVRLSRVESSRV